ncbi:helix-turn-helix domain-containing protein [Mesorhizobium humile]|uniref:helix-turn-helix domain-containing protein n=1 Tax=Mesorhizobium humile TaxID=3072313 RepID=UPI00322153A7
MPFSECGDKRQTVRFDAGQSPRVRPGPYSRSCERARRRLMLADGANAGTAGYAVGYDSPSQFSREYRRLFGAPPRQDIERL